VRGQLRGELEEDEPLPGLIANDDGIDNEEDDEIIGELDEQEDDGLVRVNPEHEDGEWWLNCVFGFPIGNNKWVGEEWNNQLGATFNTY
jgi:hypothetical protein